MADFPLATSNTVPANQSTTPLGFLANHHVHIEAGWPTLINTSWLPGQLAAGCCCCLLLVIGQKEASLASLPLGTMNAALPSGLETVQHSNWPFPSL